MKIILILFCIFSLNSSFAQAGKEKMSDKYVLVIHGGAGTILKSQMTLEKEKAYVDALNFALDTGNKILQEGGSAVDAVEAVVRTMENNPLFNAGKGAVFTNEGKNELDAAIMNGKTLAAGSIAGVTTIRNPVTAARAVMEKSPHVMLTGIGAEKFAQQQGLEIVDPSYFYTAERWKGLQRVKYRDSLLNEFNKVNESLIRNHDSISRQQQFRYADSLRKVLGIEENKKTGLRQVENRDYKYGTVGAVALDRYGNLAAATSTGGMSNKRFGRVGDSPIIGAGTYANNATVAISGTGWGEFFIRLVMAKTISDMMEFGKWKLREAAEEMIMKRLVSLVGDGGLIAVDKNGNIAMPFCTKGMYRGYMNSSGEKVVKIYGE